MARVFDFSVASGVVAVGDSLVVLTPGGEAMASAEVFALMSVLTEVEKTLGHGAWSIRHYSAVVAGVSQAASALDEASTSCEALATTLARLANDVAAQEHFRENTVRRTVDTLAYYAVSAALMRPGTFGISPRVQPPQGAEHFATTDDSAALLLGSPPSTAVTVTAVGPEHPTTPAQSMAERIARLPDTRAPIRIERYELPGGHTHTEVFIAGTDEWSVGTGEAAFDMESNLAVVAGLSAASVVATSQAMRAAGVKPGDSVSFVGHSQGGAVAVTLAESGRYNTQSVVTIGAPTGSLPVRGDYPALTIEHTGDIVPQLGGYRLPTEATVVQRDSGHFPGDLSGAHSRESYHHTAKLVDASPMTSLTDGFTHAPAGTLGVVTVFRASRLPVQQPPG